MALKEGREQQKPARNIKFRNRADLLLSGVENKFAMVGVFPASGEWKDTSI